MYLYIINLPLSLCRSNFHACKRLIYDILKRGNTAAFLTFETIDFPIFTIF